MQKLLWELKFRFFPSVFQQRELLRSLHFHGKSKQTASSKTLEEKATPMCMPFMITFLSELRPALNSLTRQSFHWLLYRGCSVAFSCLMRVTLESSCNRPSSLGTAGGSAAAAPGGRWSWLKRFPESRDIRVGVSLGVAAGLSNGKVNPHSLVRNHSLWGWQGPGDLSQWPWWCSGVLCAWADPRGG